MIIDDLLDFWAHTDPVEGFEAGLTQSRGKLFIPRDQATIHSTADRLRDRLGEITDLDLRASAAKLLAQIPALFRYPLPTDQVIDCTEGLLDIMLDGDTKAGFVTTYLANAQRLVSFEVKRWARSNSSIEMQKQCCINADSLTQTLAVLQKQNPALASQIAPVNAQIEKYKQLFFVAGIETNDFRRLFAFFKQHTTGPVATPGYEAMLKDLYGYPFTAAEIKQQGLQELAQEMPRVSALASQIGAQLGLPPTAKLHTVYKTMSKHYAVKGNAFAKAQQIVQSVTPYTAESILRLDPAPKVTLTLPPDFLLPLMTGGGTETSEYLTYQAREDVYVVPGRDQSWLTMLNVLVHEYSHAYQGALAARQDISPLLKLQNSLAIPLSEAMAFHREWEFYAAAAELLDAQKLTPAQETYLALFGADDATRRAAVTAFELETRIWRVVRYVRAVCDVEVNLGERSYVDFINWAGGYTGLSKKFIHNECFMFLTEPGYTPAYAICGARYGALQAKKLKQGVSVRDFNTQACEMGFYPWPICETKLAQFTTMKRVKHKRR